MIKAFSIPSFLKYLHIDGDNENIQVIHYDEHPEMRLKSEPVKIDFYLLALKDKIEVQPPIEEMSDAYLFFDKPGNIIEWDLKNPFAGYAIFIETTLLDKAVKDISFAGYNRHEALYLIAEEKETLYDLFKKAFTEFQKKNGSKDVLVSYASLILSYAQIYYERQFEARSKVYNKVVADFYKQLDIHLNNPENLSVLPSVAFFAEKANLSTNYFGDLIKHFTGSSPIEHIHEGIIQIAKNKLLNTKLSVSEIAYSLGFDYPTYFTRFFRSQTGISPKDFRKK